MCVCVIYERTTYFAVMFTLYMTPVPLEIVVFSVRETAYEVMWGTLRLILDFELANIILIGKRVLWCRRNIYCMKEWLE